MGLKRTGKNKTHQYIARTVGGIRLEELKGLRQTIYEGKNRFLLEQGAVNPDRIRKDFVNHYVDCAKKEFGAIEYIIELVHNIAKRPPSMIAFAFGELSHYIADLGQPLHTLQFYDESLYHSAYENDVSKHLEWLCFKYQPLILTHVDLPKFLMDYVISANSFAGDIRKAYLQGNGWGACRRETVVVFQNVCNAVANVWKHLWERINE